MREGRNERWREKDRSQLGGRKGGRGEERKITKQRRMKGSGRVRGRERRV